MNSILSPDSIIIITYLFFCIAIGCYRSIKIKSVKEYTLADRNFSTFVLACTIFATSISASSGVEKVGLIYAYGMVYAVPAMFLFLYWFLSAKLFSGRIQKFEGCLSISEIMYKLYGRSALHTTNFAVILDSIGFISIQITAMGFLFKHFFNLDYEYGVIIGFSIFTLYSAFGGVRAVILTDTFQFLIFFIGFPIACGFLFNEIGGLKSIKHLFDSPYFSIRSQDGTFWKFTSYLFYCLIPTVSAPDIQRMLIAKNKSQLTRVFTLVGFFALFFNLLLVLIAMGLKSQNSAIEMKVILYHFIDVYLPVGVSGFVLAGILAIMMSTADSWLNVSSSVLAHDIIKKFFSRISDKKELYLARFSTVLIGFISFYIALEVRKISDVLWSIRSFTQPVILVPFIVGLFGFKSKQQDFLTSVFFGIISVFVVRCYTGEFGLLSLMIGTLCSCAGFFLSSYFSFLKRGLNFMKFSYIRKVFMRTYYLAVSTFKTNNLNPNKSFYFKSFLVLFLVYNLFTSIFISTTIELKKDPIFYIRTLSAFFCIFFLCIHEFWCFKRYYFYFQKITLFVSLPFLTFSGLFASRYESPWVFGSCLVVYVCYRLRENFLGFLNSLLLSILFSFFLFLNMKLDYHKDSYEIQGYYNVAYLLCLAIAIISVDIISIIKRIQALKTHSHYLVHDLRHPMAIIKGYLDIIKNKVKDNDDLLRIVEKTYRAATKSKEIIDSTLNATLSQYNMKFENYRIGDIIAESLCAPGTKDLSHINVTQDIKNNFPIKVDKDLFIRVLSNLFNNAQDALQESKRKSIHISADIISGEKKLLIKDTGTGIKSGDLDKIYDISFTTKKSGYGIGLSFCKQSLEKMGIELSCHSVYNNFTEFCLNFSAE